MKSRNGLSAVVVLVLLAGVLAAGCGPTAPRIKAEDVWARPSMAMPAMAADEESDEEMMDNQPSAVGGGHGSGMAQMDDSPATGATGAVFMRLVNDGSQPDRLIRAESDVAAAVELHQTIMQDGVMKMSPVTAIEIPARGAVTLKPGDYHIMLLGLKRDLKPGDTFKVKLTFEKSAPLELQVTVREM
jgi:copper(I)-binding protein